LEYSVWWICPDNSEHNLASVQLRSRVLGNAQSVKKRKEGKEKIKRRNYPLTYLSNYYIILLNSGKG